MLVVLSSGLALGCAILFFLLLRQRPRLWMDPALLKALRQASESQTVEAVLQPLLHFFKQVSSGASSAVVLIQESGFKIYTHPENQGRYAELLEPRYAFLKGFFQSLNGPFQFGRGKPSGLALEDWRQLDQFVALLRLAWVIPVLDRGEHYGVILLEQLPGAKPYDAQSVKLAAYLGHQLGLALAASRIYERLRDQERRLKAIKSSLVDVSDRSSDQSYLLQKRYQAKLWKADRDLKQLHARLEARGEIEARLRHELKAPLSAMLAYFEEFSAELANPGGIAEKSEILGILKDETLRLCQLVDASKITVPTQRIASAQSPAPVACVIQESLALFAAQARQADIALKSHLEHPELLLPSLGSDVKQVLVNLISNALKYSPRSSEIIVAAASHQGRWQLSVSDRAGGIPPEALEKIFEAGQRLPHNSKRAVGEGLGLAISKDLVERWGGRIWVQNANGGSTFSFTLPLEQKVTAVHGATEQ